jgi:hypothetical protein
MREGEELSSDKLAPLVAALVGEGGSCSSSNRKVRVLQYIINLNLVPTEVSQSLVDEK